MVSQKGTVLYRVSELTKGSELRRSIKRRGIIKSVVCHERGRICFLFTDEKVIVQTSVQAFVLVPVEVPGNLWQRRLNKIRVDAQNRKIRSIDDLIRACGEGVQMAPSSLGYYV